MTYMRRAISLANLALGSTSPNPAVGAVVVKEGDIVGEGFTQPAGDSHAEIVALKQAGSSSLGAALYSTLEPCNHQGRTPPCSQAIIDAGIIEVHAAMLDPNPNVVGGGMKQFDNAGLRTILGESEGRVRKLLEAYVKFVKTGLPFVTAKFAMSLDGKIATRSGDSQWISGDKARRHVHRLRKSSDAIMVGINTVLMDDPYLTARDKAGVPLPSQPLRIVVDSKCRLPIGSRIMAPPGEVVLATSQEENSEGDNIANSEVEKIVLPNENGLVDLARLMSYLANNKKITSLLVEGGSTLLGSMFDNGLIDKVIAFVSPIIIGGTDAPTPVSGLGFERLQDSLQLNRIRWEKYGRDIAVIGYC